MEPGSVTNCLLGVLYQIPVSDYSFDNEFMHAMAAQPFGLESASALAISNSDLQMWSVIDSSTCQVMMSSTAAKKIVNRSSLQTLSRAISRPEILEQLSYVQTGMHEMAFAHYILQ